MTWNNLKITKSIYICICTDHRNHSQPITDQFIHSANHHWLLILLGQCKETTVENKTELLSLLNLQRQQVRERKRFIIEIFRSIIFRWGISWETLLITCDECNEFKIFKDCEPGCFDLGNYYYPGDRTLYKSFNILIDPLSLY